MLQKIILASGSPRRMQLLKQIGIVFEVEIPQSDESIIVGESPSELVMRLSKLKATEIANKLVTGIIIGSDTIVVLEGDVLGKPILKSSITIPTQAYKVQVANIPNGIYFVQLNEPKNILKKFVKISGN